MAWAKTTVSGHATKCRAPSLRVAYTDLVRNLMIILPASRPLLGSKGRPRPGVISDFWSKFTHGQYYSASDDRRWRTFVFLGGHLGDTHREPAAGILARLGSVVRLHIVCVCTGGCERRIYRRSVLGHPVRSRSLHCRVRSGPTGRSHRGAFAVVRTCLESSTADGDRDACCVYV